MKQFSITFRFKIFASILGIVIIFIGILLVVIRNEASKQVDHIISRTKTQANTAFAELELLYQIELQRFAKRISSKNRIPSALQEAIEEEDNKVLIDAALYELNLAQIPLAIFDDMEGNPIITLLNGTVIENNKRLKLGSEISDKTTKSIYLVISNRLYIVHKLKLSLFGRPIGLLTVGLPVDDSLVQRMGNVLSAEIDFVFNDKSLCSTHMFKKGMLNSRFNSLKVKSKPVSVDIENSRWILISEPISIGLSDICDRVIAINLTPYISPIYRIDEVFQWTGIIVLVLAVVLGVFLSRGLTVPIKRLVLATKKVTAGDLKTKVKIKSRDEFTILAESFNYMTEGLLIKEKYRGVLDKVVSPEIAEELIKGEITLGGENRQVTTLFTDIRGFTTITEGMEPQDIILMLNEFMHNASLAIESYGGVVDKYVGDQIMAIFGAPVSHKDDPLRAVLAAIKIEEGLIELNKKRVTQNKPILEVGTGINTGLAVAGNMGSVNRLNYTVLGNSVNIASRLCSLAAASEILISGHTYNNVKKDIEVVSKKSFNMKGIKKPVEVFKVNGIFDKTKQIILILIFLISGFFFQRDLFSSPDLHILSKDGSFQLDLSGRLELSVYKPQESPSYLIYETEMFVAGRLSLFADLFFGDRFYSLVELRTDRSEIPSNDALQIRLQQAFLRYTIVPSHNISIQIGKFVNPFGEYSNRHDSVADPFIRPPLMHDYRTMICPGLAPAYNDKFIGWKNIPEIFRPTGAPIIWGVPYQAGLMFSGNFGQFFFKAALMNSAPSSDPVQWDLDLKQDWNYSWVAHFDYRISPELVVGFSFNIGPYSLSKIKETLLYNQNINDYNQIMWGIDATFTLGKVQIKSELIYDIWEVPNVYDNPKDISYYLELKYKIFPGFSTAIRWNAIHFNKIPFKDYSLAKWDYDVRRLQLVIGYRLSKKLETKVEYLWNRTIGPYDPKDNLLVLQFVYQF